MAPRTPQTTLLRPARISRTPSGLAIEAIEQQLLVRPAFAPGHADPAVQKIEKAIRAHEKPLARDLLILYRYRPRDARQLGAALELWAADSSAPTVLAFPDASHTETTEQGEADTTSSRVLSTLATGAEPTLAEIREAKREAIEHRDALDDEIAALHALEVLALKRSTEAAPSDRRLA